MHRRTSLRHATTLGAKSEITEWVQLQSIELAQRKRGLEPAKTIRTTPKRKIDKKLKGNQISIRFNRDKI